MSYLQAVQPDTDNLRFHPDRFLWRAHLRSSRPDGVRKIFKDSDEGQIEPVADFAGRRMPGPRCWNCLQPPLWKYGA